MIATKHLLIFGRVQGVGFREAMRWKAQELGLAGWVRNRFDGAVEAMVQGPPEAVEALIRWAEVGPPLAHVVRVEVTEGWGSYRGFERLRSE